MSWQDKQQARRFAREMKLGTKIIHAPFARQIAAGLASVPDPITVVDLGTGPGLLAIELLKRRPGATVIGVDPSSDMLEIARENAAQAGATGFETRLGAAEAIPVETESADLVVSQASLHEWEDPAAGLAEIRRVLKPGGRLILKDYNRAWLAPWKRKLLSRIHHLDMFKFTFDQVAELMRRAGLNEIEGRERGVQMLVQAKRPTETEGGESM